MREEREGDGAGVSERRRETETVRGREGKGGREGGEKKNRGGS